MPSDPATDLSTRDDQLRRLGFADPAELDELLATLAGFCGTPVTLVLDGLPSRPPGQVWTLLRPGVSGRWLLDPGGRPWALLGLDGPRAEHRDGLDAAARQLEAMVARARARRERRAAGRGPAGVSFVPGLVHELRNAAFGFSATLDAFMERYPDRAAARRYGDALRAGLERLTGFIEELGAFGDPGSGASAALPLGPLLGEAVAACQPRAGQLGVALGVRWDGPQVLVQGDPLRLVEAFTALVRWALGQGGGTAAVLAGSARDGVATGHLEGPGLALAGLDPARVFEPFYFKAAGMGRLALPVARRILEAHGGSLRALAGPGGAVRIAFTLPCR